MPSELPTYLCRRPSGAGSSDMPGGVLRAILDDPTWLAPVTAGPTVVPPESQRTALFSLDPTIERPGAFAYQPTAFHASWTDTHLELAYACVDSDIWGTYTRRDEALYDEEVVEAFLSPTGDVRRYYEFELSPRNVVFDASVWSPDRNRRTMAVDRGWTCHSLQTAVHVVGALHTTAPGKDRKPTAGPPSRLWIALLRIPFAAFPEIKAPRGGDEWRANFYRIDSAGHGEFTAWSPTLEQPANFHVPDRFGRLVFVE